MIAGNRPLSVTVLGWIYIVVGSVGFAAHLTELHPGNALQSYVIWVELVELLAIACGVLVLRGHDWARWLSLAWMASHAILSAFHALPEFAIHCLFCGVIAWIFFSPRAARYFRPDRVERM